MYNVTIILLNSANNDAREVVFGSFDSQESEDNCVG